MYLFFVVVYVTHTQFHVFVVSQIWRNIPAIFKIYLTKWLNCSRFTQALPRVFSYSLEILSKWKSFVVKVFRLDWMFMLYSDNNSNFCSLDFKAFSHNLWLLSVFWFNHLDLEPIVYNSLIALRIYRFYRNGNFCKKNIEN